jgi:hypothetical protein
VLTARIAEHGGLNKVASDVATDFVNALYATTFDNLTGSFFVEPFISSFCSHSKHQAYEVRNGLLSQWRGYGRDGGYCIVFNTAELAQLLGREFDSHYWVHLNINEVNYDVSDTSIEQLFPILLDRCDYFLSHVLAGSLRPPMVEDGFAPFVAAATLFKHQGFREESEVRIVAMPGSGVLLDQVQREHSDFRPAPLKPILSAATEEGRRRRYVVLFDNLKIKLPIKRIIVGPSRHQEQNYRRARELIDANIQIDRSETPFIG